jgi:hypothetical protein
MLLDDILLIRQHDSAPPGVIYGLSDSEIERLELICGLIHDTCLLEYLRSFCPKWPKEECEGRREAPDLLDYDSILKEMKDYLPSRYLSPLGFVPLHRIQNGDSFLANISTGEVILGDHERVSSEQDAKEAAANREFTYFSSVSELWGALADYYRSHP